MRKLGREDLGAFFLTSPFSCVESSSVLRCCAILLPFLLTFDLYCLLAETYSLPYPLLMDLHYSLLAIPMKIGMHVRACLSPFFFLVQDFHHVPSITPT